MCVTVYDCVCVHAVIFYFSFSFRYLIHSVGGGKSKATARAIIIDLGKFLYFVDPDHCPSLNDALTQDHIKGYLKHLDVHCRVGPCGRATKMQVIGQVARYLASLAKEKSDDYVR